MKRVSYFFIILSVMMTTSCTEKKAEADRLNPANMDTTAAPGRSFYQYATGGWQEANPIPDEYARYGSFDKLREENQEQIQSLITALGEQENPAGSNAQKVGDLYTLGMDSVKLNSDGSAPLRGQLTEIAAAKSQQDIVLLMAKVSHYASNPFLDLVWVQTIKTAG